MVADNVSSAQLVNDRLDRMIELLESAVRLQVRGVLERELHDKKMRDLYESTGKLSASELAKSLRMSASTICAAWKRWEDLGLIVKDGKTYRRVV